MAGDLIQATLLYRLGPEKDFPVPEGAEVGLGQEQDNAVRIPFPGVSRHHARMTYDGKTYWVEDVGSANGTFVNGRRVVKKERLEHLDVLALGRKTELIFLRRKLDAARVTQRGIKNAWLEIVDGLEAGTRREIPRGAITIGRSNSNNVVSDSRLVSKIHVRLERSGIQLLLIDLQSSNGTFMEGEKIESRVLADGDEFTLGNVRSYRVHIEYGDVVTQEQPRRVSSMSIVQSLPTDWKTRIEWSPEEKAALEQFQSGAPSAPSEEVKAAEPSAPIKFPAPPAPSATPAASSAAREPSKSAQPEISVKPPPPAPAPPSASKLSSPPAASAPASPPGAAKTPAPPQTSEASKDSSFLEETRAVPSAPVVRVTLEGKNQAFPLAAGEHVVGRVAGVAIRLDTPQISRRHAILRVSKTETVVEDLGSSNGTFVNKEKIAAPRTLAEGDTVLFGDIPFVVKYGQGTRAGPKVAG